MSALFRTILQIRCNADLKNFQLICDVLQNSLIPRVTHYVHLAAALAVMNNRPMHEDDDFDGDIAAVSAIPNCRIKPLSIPAINIVIKQQSGGEYRRWRGKGKAHELTNAVEDATAALSSSATATASTAASTSSSVPAGTAAFSACAGTHGAGSSALVDHGLNSASPEEMLATQREQPSVGGGRRMSISCADDCDESSDAGDATSSTSPSPSGCGAPPTRRSRLAAGAAVRRRAVHW